MQISPLLILHQIQFLISCPVCSRPLSLTSPSSLPLPPGIQKDLPQQSSLPLPAHHFIPASNFSRHSLETCWQTLPQKWVCKQARRRASELHSFCPLFKSSPPVSTFTSVANFLVSLKSLPPFPGPWQHPGITAFLSHVCPSVIPLLTLPFS